ncbi:TolC family protein [Stenotrophomonas sp. MH1]|uniref:TolC family protein n=1 Tax=Stenotrophomonas capsici TaxID=3110230 RepID=A0ABU5UY31_9GAMM|nr:TolC family protein [Stenotrophomonas sp. MH1]MEA5666010.1 TolC family protein [Stenotrophomonas sp. MH1]
MWMRLAAIAAFALVPRVYAQAPASAVPLSLDAAIARVAVDHPDLQLVDAQRPVLEARRDAASLRPPLQFGADVENLLGSGDNRGLKGLETTVSLSGVLERGGKLDARRLLAQSNLDALAPQRATARLDLLAETARRYLDVARAQSALDIALTDIEQRRRAVNAARVRLQAGASPESVLFTAQAMLAQAELDRDRATQEAASARLALAALWGARQAGFASVSGNALRLPAARDFDVLADELQRAPELAELLGEERVRDAQLQLARTAARPDWNWQVGVRNSRADSATSLVGGFSIPLGSARRAAPEIREAEANLALLPYERKARLQQLYATLAEAHGRYAGARLEVERLQRDVLPQLQKAERAAEQAWRAGAASYMEWAQLQAMRIEARQRQLDSAIAAQTALIEIQRLTGQSMLADDATVALENAR